MNVTECPGMAKIYKPQLTKIRQFPCLYPVSQPLKWSLKSLTNMQKSTAPGHSWTWPSRSEEFWFLIRAAEKGNMHNHFYEPNNAFSHSKKYYKRSTNKSKPLIIHFTYLYMIINCVSLFSRKGCCCVCMCLCFMCVCWSDSQGEVFFTNIFVFKDQIIL